MIGKAEKITRRKLSASSKQIAIAHYPRIRTTQPNKNNHRDYKGPANSSYFVRTVDVLIKNQSCEIGWTGQLREFFKASVNCRDAVKCSLIDEGCRN